MEAMLLKYCIIYVRDLTECLPRSPVWPRKLCSYQGGS